MALIYHVTWEWTGSPGMPGFTNLFFNASTPSPANALTACNNSRLLFNGVASLIPSTVTISLHPDVRVINDADGILSDIYTVAGVTPVVGGAAAAYSSPVGGGIDWLSTTVHGTRRLQGRTFLVPLTGAAFDGNGSLATTTLTAIATAAEAMRTATGPTFGIWGRPRKANPDATPPVTERAGLWGQANSSRVPDKSFVLTSRRD